MHGFGRRDNHVMRQKKLCVVSGERWNPMLTAELQQMRQWVMSTSRLRQCSAFIGCLGFGSSLSYAIVGVYNFIIIFNTICVSFSGLNLELKKSLLFEILSFRC